MNWIKENVASLLTGLLTLIMVGTLCWFGWDYFNEDDPQEATVTRAEAIEAIENTRAEMLAEFDARDKKRAEEDKKKREALEVSHQQKLNAVAEAKANALAEKTKVEKKLSQTSFEAEALKKAEADRLAAAKELEDAKPILASWTDENYEGVSFSRSLNGKCLIVTRGGKPVTLFRGKDEKFTKRYQVFPRFVGKDLEALSPVRGMQGIKADLVSPMNRATFGILPKGIPHDEAVVVILPPKGKAFPKQSTKG